MAPQKKLTIPAVPASGLSKEAVESLKEMYADTLGTELIAAAAPPAQLDLGPTKGERGEFLPATYKTASGSIRSDR